RTHLAAPGIAGERRKLHARHPIERLECEAGRVAARISVPAPDLELRFHLSGAHHDVIAALYGDPLHLRGMVEIAASDRIAVFEHSLSEPTRHVEKHAAADHLILGLLDSALLRTVRCDLAAVVAVPHRVLI